MVFWEREPSYEGKTLSGWLQIYSVNAALYRADPLRNEKSEAREAVRQIGTNAVPWLLRWMQIQKPPWHDAVLNASRRWKAGQWLLSPVVNYAVRRGQMANYAQLGFEVLGEQASGAVPELKRLLAATKPPTQFSLVTIPTGPASALAYTGHDGIQVLASYVEPKNPWRGFIVEMLAAMPERLGTNTAILVPTLIKSLHGPDVLYAAQCAKALGSFAIRADEVVPELINGSQSPYIAVALASIEALQSYGQKAKGRCQRWFRCATVLIPDFVVLPEQPWHGSPRRWNWVIGRG